MMPEMASREPPVGSSDSDSYHDTIVLNQPKSDPDQYRVKQLEEERDNLQKNMISLTSRLAQVKDPRVSQSIASRLHDLELQYNSRLNSEWVKQLPIRMKTKMIFSEIFPNLFLLHPFSKTKIQIKLVNIYNNFLSSFDNNSTR